MLKFKRKEVILKRVLHKKNKQFYSQLLRESKAPYRYRKIMRIRAMRLDIRIRCRSCRIRYIKEHTHKMDSIIATILSTIKGYVPFDKFECVVCKSYMHGGLHF